MVQNYHRDAPGHLRWHTAEKEGGPGLPPSSRAVPRPKSPGRPAPGRSPGSARTRALAAVAVRSGRSVGPRRPAPPSAAVAGRPPRFAIA
jgi:hypothetical protein